MSSLHLQVNDNHAAAFSSPEFHSHLRLTFNCTTTLYPNGPLHHGFQLSSINGVQVEACSLDDLCQDLLTLPKPVTLVFRPLLSNAASDDSSESQCSVISTSSSASPDVPGSDGIELHGDAHQTLATTSAAPHRCPDPASSAREQYEYEVVWTSTRLGLKLDMPYDSERQSASKDKTNGMSTRRRYPIVHQILKESTLGLPPDAVGHSFVSINNWRTFGLKAEELRTLLGAASKPAVLRFRRRDALLRSQPTGLPTLLHTVTATTDDGSTDDREATFGSAYSILWSEGKLGIVFGCYEDANSHDTLVVYVKSIGPGQALKSTLVDVGDILHSIDGRDLPPKQNFKKAVRKLINASTSRPVTLGFRRTSWSPRSTGRHTLRES
ncbi:unnamed protein product [Hyaloperonospora brassicae]|uniref:PDZ domain-containing protein n=1 Tax=Hyaloperonospora brassicae TaxID=162125 RepID=A0AAV0V2T4_HYABA|nr:unnamed protein product [Hyaloperonospora brassicae]